MKPKIITLAGLVLTWIAVFKSTVNLSVPQSELDAYFANQGPLPVAGIGGWPFPTFHYPPPPLGGDIPPITSVYPFMLNWIFWSLIAAVIIWFLPKRLLTKPVHRIISGAALLASLGGLLFLLVKFD